ncbi:MAG: CHRD domain-containing protein [Acidimicrobiaceae bacterium]|nr:CHRD domain-containing protein [Acidimicrobiaceae bacterium]
MDVKKFLVTGVVLGALALAGASTAWAAPTNKTFVVDATGSGVAGGMGMKTSGYAKGTVKVNAVSDTVCYRIYDRGLGVVEAAHIHAGKKGVDGGVVVTLNVKMFNRTKPACVKVTSVVAKSLLRFPAFYYFNVHTRAFPSGAVRAQL